MIPEDQFAPTQDIPFEGGYALSPDTSAMMQAGSQNMDQPIFPRLRPGMPALNPQDIETLMTAPARPAPPPQGVLTDEELNAIRARQGGYEPLPQLQQAEVRWDEGLRATAPGETASDVFFRQLRGEEDRTQAEVAEIPTLEEQFPKTPEEDLIASIRFSKQLEGITNYNYLGRNVNQINEGFDRVMADRFLQRDLRAGNLNSKFVTDYIRNSKIGDDRSAFDAVTERLKLGSYQLASGARAAGSAVWAVLANEGVMPYSVIAEDWAPETLADAIAWAEYGRSLQENKFVPDSMAGRITLDLVELIPAYTFQLTAAALGGGLLGYAVAGGGIAGASQFNDSLATYVQAGVDPQRAAQLAMRDGAYSLASMTVSDAIFGRLALVGKIGKKTAKAVERAANATKMQVIGKGVSRGILGEGVPEGVESASVDFLVNLHREGMPEFAEFYKQNPDWVYDVLRNAGYETLLGSMIGAPVGIRTQFRAAADARQVNETMRTVFGALPQDHPVMRLFEKDALTVEDASKALTWLSKTREKIGKITAADIEAQRKVGAGLEYGNLSNEALQNIIIAGNDGSVTAPLRGAPEGGRFAGIEFAITPSMAADELARRGLSTGQAPGAATAVGVRAMPTDVDPQSVSAEDVGAWASNNERMAAAMAAQAEPISRRQMEEVFGGPFQGNNSSLRARFKENLTRALNQRAGLRDPARLSASIENARRAAAQDAVEMLTGLDGIELQRVAIGLSPRQAKAVSETLAEAERESRRRGLMMPIEQMYRQGQDDRAVAMQRQREEAGMAAAAGARGEIGRGEVARRAGEREAARRATEREQRMDEVVRAGTASAAMREAQDTAVEALDRVEGVIRGDEFEQAVPMTDAMDAISVVEELARQAGIDPDTAMAPIRARATALAAVEKYARTQDLTPGMRGAMDTTRRERTGRRVADIILEARREAIDQYERDERAMVEDPNYVVSQQDAVRFLSRDPESAEDIATVIRSGSALGLQLAETRRRIESGAILAEGQEVPVVRGVEEEGASPEAGVARAAEMRLRERIDRLRRTGSTEIPAAPTPTMAETRAAVDVALISEQEQVEKQIRDLKMEQAELRRERKELADAAHTGKRGQRTKKRKPPTEREKQVAQRLEEITAQLKELDGQVQEIAGRRGIVSEAILEPVGVKETDSFPGVTADKRLEQIVKGRREIAEMNGIGADELKIRYEDGKTRLTPAEKRLSAFGRKLGVTVVFARGPKGLRTRGAYTSGVVFIRQSDATSPQAYFSVALHEAMHHLANTDKEYFTNLYNMLRRKAPRALRQMSTVYRAKLEAQKNLAAPRNAALQIMSETGPDADRRKTALMWLIRNDRGPDFATIRENPGATLAEMIDSYRPAEGRANAPTDTDEVRAAFADLTRRARQVNLSVRSTQEEEVANLAEMLMDTAFVSAVDEDGKIDLTRIRQIADTPRAVSLFGRLSEMITDVADAIGVAKKDRGLNEAQAAKLREFMAKPEELADAKVRRAVQQLVAKSLTHMMDMRRGKVDTEVAKANPMSDARAAEEIPAVMPVELDVPVAETTRPRTSPWSSQALMKQLLALPTRRARFEFLRDRGLIEFVGDAPAVDVGRLVVIAKVNGVRVPFYVSTGLGGKDIAIDQWYPFFGLTDQTWFVKLSSKEIARAYGSPVLASIKNVLDQSIGSLERPAGKTMQETRTLVAAYEADTGLALSGDFGKPEIRRQMEAILKTLNGRDVASIDRKNAAQVRQHIDDSIAEIERGEPAIQQSLDMPETDAEYMAAVQGGDTDKAQRMVDEAAIEAGYTVGPVYHGTFAKFNEFDLYRATGNDLGFHFGDSAAAENRLSDLRQVSPQRFAKAKQRILRVRLRMENPLRLQETRRNAWQMKDVLAQIFDGETVLPGFEQDLDAYLGDELESRVGGKWVSYADLSDNRADETEWLGNLLLDKGYDGIVYENRVEGGTSYIVYDPNRIKLVDPVTRDDAGNVIPLSRRFDVSTPDIRQSIDMPSAAEMNAERGDMVDRIDGSYRNNDANIEPGDIDDAERTIDQSLSDEDSRFGRLSRAVNDTARRLTGREVPTREDRDAIEVVKRPADISPFWKFVAAPLNIAIASKNAEVISVVEDIIDFDIRRNMLTERRNREARTRWESIPQAERNEAEFAKYMDEFHDPATIDSDPEFAGKSQAWRDALKWFKERDEARRKDIIAVKREGIRRALQRDKASRIVDKAAQYGLEWEVVRGRRNRVRIRTADGEVTVDQARDSLASTMMPDTWGRQYAHFFHWFAGEWKLTAYDADGNRTIIGSAKTEAEAFERLYRHRRDNPGQYRRYQAEPNVFVNPDDVVRLSTGQKRRLESLLAQATGASRTDVDDSLRGIVGSKGAKRPFYAPLMERTGAQGFETDFMKVWELSERLHNRWVMGGEMVRTITPRIEKIRQTMPGWAKYLDETMDHTMFTRPTAVEQAVDRFVRSIPVVGRLTSPFFTRRWLGAARALNYGRQLLTVRQQVVNSFQPIQTLYPVLGEANFAKAVSFYNSPEAKEVLERHGRMSADGKFREGSEETIPGVDIGGFLTRMNESVYKQTNGGVNLSSEARNQNFAFIAMYWHATNNLNMGDAEAARYARIYGNVYTQFYYTKANLPWIVRGPVAATALQYRRFMINMTGLMVNEFQKGNYSGVGRYLGTQFILGGSQAVLGFSALGLIRSLYLGDKEGADDLTFKMRAWLKDSLGSEKAADIAMMGLPAAVGIDLSGSISVWQKPFGRTIYEKAGATFAGPTVNTLLQAYTNLTGDTVVPMNPLERGYRAFAETSPTIQQMVAAWKAFNGDNAEYDARGRLKYTLDPEDAWIKAGAFRTVDESIWRMEYERLRIIRNEVDRYSDRAATQLAVGNTAEARRILGEFNGMYPMAAMTFKDIKRRAEGKRQARTMPLAERRVEVDVGTRVREIAQAEGIGE